MDYAGMGMGMGMGMGWDIHEKKKKKKKKKPKDAPYTRTDILSNKVSKHTTITAPIHPSYFKKKKG